MTIIQAGSRWQILGASGAAASHTGNIVETTLATIAVPAGAMGANGILRITTAWSYTNSANNKTLRVRYGGTIFYTLTATTTATLRHQVQIHNRNSASSQISQFDSGFSFSTATGAHRTGTINSAAAQNITITGELANTGETITLEAYLVELCYRS